MNSYIIFDFETGGFNPEENPAIELAAVAIRGDNFEELGRFNHIIKPYNDNLKYEDGAYKVHGISKYEAENFGTPLKDVVKEFISFCKVNKKGKGKSEANVLVGHNPQFDIKFLHQIFNYAKIKMKDEYFKGDIDFYGNFNPVVIDTIDEARKLWQEDDSIRYNLSSCIERAGLELTDAHRAMNDVLATRDLFVWFIQKLRNNQDNIEGQVNLVKKIRARDTMLKI